MLHGLTLRKQIQIRQTALLNKDRAHGGGQHGGAAAGLMGSLSSSATALTDVHVRPSRTMSSADLRPQRLYLVGRVPLDFTTSSSCFYGSHDAMSYCDYCTPSAAIKVLLRLMAGTSASAQPVPAGGSPFSAAAAAAVPPPMAAQEDEVCHRFAAARGMYGVLLLLHHETAGVHHSKLAASLLTLLDLLLLHAPGAQVRCRTATCATARCVRDACLASVRLRGRLHAQDGARASRPVLVGYGVILSNEPPEGELPHPLSYVRPSAPAICTACTIRRTNSAWRAAWMY